jgi:hypothetical protein
MDINIKELIDKLPTDIVLQIIPYTYNIQNINLLKDIKNYNNQKTHLLELYYNFWIIKMQSEDPEEYKYWLLNDIIGYCNWYVAIMNGYVEYFYSILNRNIFLKTREKMNKYIINLEKKNISSQINIFLGLLTIEERNRIIKTFTIYNN